MAGRACAISGSETGFGGAIFPSSPGDLVTRLIGVYAERQAPMRARSILRKALERLRLPNFGHAHRQNERMPNYPA
jgi:hypothetical protein